MLTICTLEINRKTQFTLQMVVKKTITYKRKQEKNMYIHVSHNTLSSDYFF